jgi:phage baseplate assembly protein W
VRDLQLSSGDIALSGGDFGTVTGSAYIRQRIATALSEPYNSDPYEPAWGSTLDSYFGAPITSGTPALVSGEVSRVLAVLIAAQTAAVTSWSLTGARARLAAADTIASVQSVTASVDQDPEMIDVSVILTTQAGVTMGISRIVTPSLTSS